MFTTKPSCDTDHYAEICRQFMKYMRYGTGVALLDLVSMVCADLFCWYIGPLGPTTLSLYSSLYSCHLYNSRLYEPVPLTIIIHLVHRYSSS